MNHARFFCLHFIHTIRNQFDTVSEAVIADYSNYGVGSIEEIKKRTKSRHFEIYFTLIFICA